MYIFLNSQSVWIISVLIMQPQPLNSWQLELKTILLTLSALGLKCHPVFKPDCLVLKHWWIEGKRVSLPLPSFQCLLLFHHSPYRKSLKWGIVLYHYTSSCLFVFSLGDVHTCLLSEVLKIFKVVSFCLKTLQCPFSFIGFVPLGLLCFW